MAEKGHIAFIAECVLISRESFTRKDALNKVVCNGKSFANGRRCLGTDNWTEEMDGKVVNESFVESTAQFAAWGIENQEVERNYLNIALIARYMASSTIGA